MKSRLNARAAMLGTAIFAFNAGAFAQLPPIAGSQPPLYDPPQLPPQQGQVQQFTLTLRGDIDGLILTDGTEVKTPPHLSTQIAFSIKPGDTVVIHGLHAAALPLVQAVSITDETTGRTVVDNGPPPPDPGPGLGLSGPVAGLSEVQGRIRMPLHGPRGDVNGALLEDGTILRLPPPEAERFTALLQAGQTVVAEGVQLANPIGRMLAVRQIGSSRDQLNQVLAPPGPGGKKGRRGPPPV
jgi:hypothetical protein